MAMFYSTDKQKNNQKINQMKTKYLIIALSLVTVSCSNDEPVSVTSSNALISFNAQQEVAPFEESRTAVETTVESLKDLNFAVYGSTSVSISGKYNWHVIFNEDQIYFKNNTWDYDEAEYWIPTNKYRFFAVGPYLDAKGGTTKTNNWSISGFSEKYATFNSKDSKIKLTFNNDADHANGDVDLVWAYTALEPDGGVTPNEDGHFDTADLSFKHVLSRVKFEFIYSTDISIKNVTLNTTVSGYIETQDIPSIPKGDDTYDNLNWSNTSSGDINFGDVDSDTHQTGAKYIMSNVNTSTTYKFKYTLGDSDTATEGEFNDVTMLKGHSYLFIVTLDTNTRAAGPQLQVIDEGQY
jgi:hypothetical protein